MDGLISKHVNAYEGPTPTNTLSMSFSVGSPTPREGQPGLPSAAAAGAQSTDGQVSAEEAVTLVGDLLRASHPNPMFRMCLLRLVRMWTSRETESAAHFALTRAKGVLQEAFRPDPTFSPFSEKTAFTASVIRELLVPDDATAASFFFINSFLETWVVSPDKEVKVRSGEELPTKKSPRFTRR